MIRTLLLLLLLAAQLAGCEMEPEPGGPGGPTATSGATSPAPVETPAQSSTPDSVETPLPTPGVTTLTIWTSPEISPNNDVPGGAVLLDQLNRFDNEHASLSLLVELKTIGDQGGILSYLRTGRSVAPAILPDIVLLPASQLRPAAAQGLIVPLDGLLDPDAIEDLFPVARELAQVDEQLYGYPFALTNLQHVVYNSSAITRTLSADWDDILQDPPGAFLYAAAGSSGAELTAKFYHALDGQFVDESGQPQLQTEPLIRALELVRLGATQGFIDPTSGSISSLDQVWQLFQENSGRIVLTTANHYLARRSDVAGASLRFVSAPGPNGALTPTVSAWTWAISTPDPERSAAAADLINWLASAENLGAWSLQSASLPGRQAALGVWPDDSYLTFLQRQIGSATPIPAGLNNTVLTALSNATSAVLLGLSTPADAADQARSALAP